jgi:luciferase-like monooxygenase
MDHPVFPGKVGPAARRIENEADVRDVIALLRLNYDRIVAGHGVPAETSA